MTEYWRLCKDFPEYEVSNLGRVRSVDRETSVIGPHRRRRYKGRVLKGSKDANGYGRICLWRNNRQHGAIIHRLVVEAFLREIGDNEEVNHLDCDKSNNALDNLEIVSRPENMEHAARNGRMAKKLTSDQVAKIKCLLTNESRQTIADRFGVSYRLIRLIDIGELWQHIPSG